MYDNTCKFLAENFPTDFATWLLGKPIALTKLEPSELSVEPIRADSVIFLQSAEIILHVEFQTAPDPNIPFRMLDYRVRLYRKFPISHVHQFIIYLDRTKSELVYETTFTLPNTAHKFNVIRLWEEPTAIFQEHLGLLPFAPLSNTNPEETLKQVAKQIANISDRNLQSNIAASTYITSGLVLNKEIIQRLLRSEIMKESVTYQEILLEGKTEGQAEATRQIAKNMLRSQIDINLISQFTGLSMEEIQKLQNDLI
jgi:predicted transposase/invertase (TIGR01784 family)